MAEEFHDAREVALRGLFDDAAVFPPASRDVPDALSSHRGHQEGERAWLVNRLLVRASQTAALSQILAETDDLAVGVVLDRASGDTFQASVAADLNNVAGIARDRRIRLTGLEMALGSDDPDAQLSVLLSALQGARLPEEQLTIAVEVPVAGRPAGEVLRGLNAIAASRAPGGRFATKLVAKIRCGGLTANAIPADIEVAGFLLACAKLGIPFKATAGLHHPTRVNNADHGGLEHGFLNILAAATAAHLGAKLDVIDGHLSRPAAQFKLGPGAMIVDADVVEGDVLDDVRTRFFMGIGCCDILDPITDLAQMGVVSATGGLK